MMSWFTFIVYRHNRIRLEVWSRHGVLGNWYYPMTYTIKECLEDWCENRGHQFVLYNLDYHEPWHARDVESGSFKIVRGT